MLVLEQLNAFLQNHEHGDECPFWTMAGTDTDCTCGLQEARAIAANTLAAAPPPPAEQASGEHVETLREIRLAYGDAPNHFTAEKAALDHAIAALSQRPVVTFDYLAQAIRVVDGRHALGAAALAEALMPFLAPQQPEKGEGA